MYANRDPRRYRTPTTPSNLAPNVTPQLPASVAVPAIAPPVSTAPSYANRDPRRYRTPQAADPPPAPLPQATPQLPASVTIPAIAPPISTPAPQQQENSRRGGGSDTPRANRLPRPEPPRIQQPQQVYQAPPAMAPAPVAASPPVMNAPPPNFRRGPQPEASSNGGDEGAPCNPRRGNCQ